MASSMPLPRFDDDANWGPIDDQAFAWIAAFGLSRLKATLPNLIEQVDLVDRRAIEFFELLAILAIWVAEVGAKEPKRTVYRTERAYRAAIEQYTEQKVEIDRYRAEIRAAIERKGRWAREFEGVKPSFLRLLYVARRDRPTVLVAMSAKDPDLALLHFLLLDHVPEFVQFMNLYFVSARAQKTRDDEVQRAFSEQELLDSDRMQLPEGYVLDADLFNSDDEPLDDPLEDLGESEFLDE